MCSTAQDSEYIAVVVALHCSSVVQYRFGKYLISKFNTGHSQLLHMIKLKFTPPVLLNLLCSIFHYCPALKAIQRFNSSSIDFPGRSMLYL